MSAQQGEGNAGLVTRLLAAAVDAVAVVIATAGLYLGATGISFFWSPLRFQWPHPSPWTSTLTLMWSRRVPHGRVGDHGPQLRGYPARRTCPRAESRRLGWIRAMLRAITCVLVPIGLLWTAISPARRSWQDILVGTVVVYDRYRDRGEHAMTPGGSKARRRLPP